jgi:hypothetical protein
MVFINELKSGQIEGFLDTEEKLKEAREALEKHTEEAFRQLDSAKMSSWEHAHSIFLD